jgi:hypothetical protein
MQPLGLPQPSTPSAAPAPALSSIPTPRPVTIGGVLSIASAQTVLDQQAKAAIAQEAQMQQSQPVIGSLAGHVMQFWHQARVAKEQIEPQLLEAVWSRRGQYTPEMLAKLNAQASSTIYMMLFSTKCRQAASLLRDILLGSGTDKPWTIDPTPSPDLPPSEVNQIMQGVAQEVHEAQMAGMQVPIDAIRQRLTDAKEELVNRLREEAVTRAERMETKMEDQLDEGNFNEALDQFIDDLTTFKTAFLKGPVVRKKPAMAWAPDGQLVVTQKLKLEWERVDPFMMYPAPWAKDCDSAPLIERHKLSREDLVALIGVEGYSEAAIRQVLDQYGTGGLSNWLVIDTAKAQAEGRNTVGANAHSGLIDALQYWGSVSGKLLREWGMTAQDVPDEAKEYQVEAWVIGSQVIKAVLNADPLARRPYFAHSYERVPGCFWGNSLYDLIRDCQDMCNAAARALVNNLGISSGPQVAINVDRLPVGENITAMYPWKIWQVTSDPMGSTARPIDFFQPTSNAGELMQVYEQFSEMADEYSGIPRYMTGNEGTPGAGRTASGLSMMIGNASKIIKQVIIGIDNYVISPALQRLYYYNMRYGTDPDLKGDVNILAKGAISLTAKEAAQVRRNEFLQATLNPIDFQIVGMEGRAELLRSAAKSLDLNPDRIVPPISVLRQRAAAAQAAAQQMPQPGPPGMQGAQPPQLPGPPNQQLMNGAPVADHFQPAGAPA